MQKPIYFTSPLPQPKNTRGNARKSKKERIITATYPRAPNPIKPSVETKQGVNTDQFLATGITKPGDKMTNDHIRAQQHRLQNQRSSLIPSNPNVVHPKKRSRHNIDSHSKTHTAHTPPLSGDPDCSTYPHHPISFSRDVTNNAYRIEPRT